MRLRLLLGCLIASLGYAQSYDIGHRIYRQHLAAQKVIQFALAPFSSVLFRLKKRIEAPIFESGLILGLSIVQRPFFVETLTKLDLYEKLWAALKKLTEKQRTHRLTLHEKSELARLQYQSRYWKPTESIDEQEASKKVSQAVAPPTLTQAPGVKERAIGDGTYVVTNKLLGKGQFGKVYLGRNTQAKKLIAVKIVDRTNITLQEYRVWQNFEPHPNILRLFSAQSNGERLIFLMEYCPGGDLDQAIKKGLLRNNEQRVRRLFRQFLSGLQALLIGQVVHRDLKSANLFLNSENLDEAELKIGDFGFARHFEQSQLLQSVLGTPMYMPPERLLQGEYGVGSEMWAAGIILYEMLYGRHVFLGARNLNEIFTLMKGLSIEDNQAFSSGSHDLLRKLLVFDPAQRMGIEEALDHPWFSTDIIDRPIESTARSEPVPQEPQTTVPEHAEQRLTQQGETNGGYIVVRHADSGWDLDGEDKYFD